MSKKRSTDDDANGRLSLPATPTGTFDVFLSHNSKDKPAIRKLADALVARGLKPWLDEREQVPGRPWQEALELIIATAQTAAVLVGKDGLGPWEEPEMRGCLSEFVRRKMPVIPVLLPGAPTEPELPLFLKAFNWVDLRGGLTEDGLDRLEWGIRGEKPGSAVSKPTPTRLSGAAAHPERDTAESRHWRQGGRYASLLLVGAFGAWAATRDGAGSAPAAQPTPSPSPKSTLTSAPVLAPSPTPSLQSAVRKIVGFEAQLRLGDSSKDRDTTFSLDVFRDGLQSPIASGSTIAEPEGVEIWRPCPDRSWQSCETRIVEMTLLSPHYVPLGECASLKVRVRSNRCNDIQLHNDDVLLAVRVLALLDTGERFQLCASTDDLQFGLPHFQCEYPLQADDCSGLNL